MKKVIYSCLKNNRITAIILVFLFLAPLNSVSIELPNLTNTESTVLYVGGNGPGNYTTIQSAINNATDGDTIFVYQGIYYEHLIVDKELKLTGEIKEETIVHGSNTGDVPCFSVRNDNVEIHNFTIMWADWEYHEPGIKIFSDNVLVKNCNISYHDKGVLLFYSSKNCTITNNEFYTVFEGIYLWQPGSNDHLIKNNHLKKCHYGIKLVSSQNNNIKNNSIDSSADTAILLEESDQNSIFDNYITNSSRGIFVLKGSNNNLIYHNNLIDNIQQAASNGKNQWDKGNIIGGNYWDDYTGIDEDEDGIGEPPYMINGANIDRYPFVKENYWNSVSPVDINIDCPNEGFINQRILFNVTIENEVFLDILWNFGDNQTSKQKNTTHTYKKPGLYNVTVTVTDQLGRITTRSKTMRIYPQDENNPHIYIKNPKNGMYINNKLMVNWTLPIVIAVGSLQVEIVAKDFETRIVELRVVIEGELEESINGSYFNYNLTSSNIGFYDFYIEAVDYGGNKEYQNMKILKT